MSDEILSCSPSFGGWFFWQINDVQRVIRIGFKGEENDWQGTEGNKYFVWQGCSFRLRINRRISCNLGAYACRRTSDILLLSSWIWGFRFRIRSGRYRENCWWDGRSHFAVTLPARFAVLSSTFPFCRLRIWRFWMFNNHFGFPRMSWNWTQIGTWW